MQGRLDTYWAKAGKIWAAQNIKREHGKTRTARRVEVAAFMADIVKDLDEPKILEVGCNYGENLACLREVLPKAQLFGIDISDDSINVARQRNQGADYLTSSVYDLPYKEGEFDMVFTMGVMIHLHPSDIKHAIGSVAKLSNRHIIF
jgi:2-polyprenyl-3-methyl-5-hydroxy-6-metoxy-1,4-benzoquinol methylase